MNGAAARRGGKTAGWFEGEKGLVLTGLLGFVLAGICGIWVLLNGGPVSPDGDVSKAFSFNAAIGIFLLSTAAIAPFSGMSPGKRTFFRRTYILLALYSYAAENIQNFRGVNPRFVQDGSAFDNAVSSGFALVAFLLVAFYLFFAVHFFSRKAYAGHPLIVLAIRYAMAATLISFAAGIWISVNQGRFTGVHGNIIWLHGLGFHAMQAVPLVAWLAERSTFPSPARRLWIHVTGASYFAGLAAIGIQTWNGLSLLEWSVYPVLAGCCFLVSLAAGAIVLRRAWKQGLGRVRTGTAAG
ncbi:hypothetical protein [Cohnella caldifontis]|uniref:hypothetical protein n=1 Tax=Cohnella caldifontis TaxID=3027471 RepID=UPI0023EC86E7|nr:hypothetical protein [Cohnella sp. YIM B05605]